MHQNPIHSLWRCYALHIAVFIIAVTFIPLASCLTSTSSHTTISDITIPNFFQKHKQQLTIDSSMLDHRIVIEVQATLPSMQSDQQFNLILLAAEPSSALPDYYTILFQSTRIQKYRKQKIRIDYEGYSTYRPFQFIEISSVTTSLIGTWSIGLYDLRSDSKATYNVKVRVLDFGKEESFYCPDNCNASLSQQNQCIGDTSNWCSCNDNYSGSTCAMKLIKGNENTWITINIPPFEWRTWWMDAHDLSSEALTIQLKGMYAVIGATLFGSESTIVPVPNMLTGETFELQTMKIDMQRQIISKVNISALLGSQTISKHGKSIMIGIYNPSSKKTLSFSFKLESLYENPEESSLITQPAVFVSVIIGSLVVFGVAPVTYFFIKNKKKQKASQNEAANQQQSINQQEVATGERNNFGLPAGFLNSRQQQGMMEGIVSTSSISSGRMIEGFVIKKCVPITKQTMNSFMPKQVHENVMRLYPTLKDEGGNECMVCLEAFVTDSECRITPCFHLFHSECLESWFAKHSTCPYCRAICNRKGIVKMLQMAGNNPYISRIQNKSKLQEEESDEAEEIDTDQLKVDSQQQQQTQEVPGIVNAQRQQRVLGFAEILLNSIKRPVQNLFRGSESSQLYRSNSGALNNQMKSKTDGRDEIIVNIANDGHHIKINNNNENNNYEVQQQQQQHQVICLSQTRFLSEPQQYVGCHVPQSPPAEMLSMISSAPQDIEPFSLNITQRSVQNQRVMQDEDCCDDIIDESKRKGREDTKDTNMQNLVDNMNVFNLKNRRRERGSVEFQFDQEEEKYIQEMLQPVSWRDGNQIALDNSTQLESTTRKMMVENLISKMKLTADSVSAPVSERREAEGIVSTNLVIGAHKMSRERQPEANKVIDEEIEEEKACQQQQLNGEKGAVEKEPVTSLIKFDDEDNDE